MAVSGDILETAKTFIRLLDGDENYAAASEYIDDDFAFVSPLHNIKGKDDFLTQFPKMHKDRPTFEEIVLDEGGKTATRHGSKKIAFLKLALKEVFEFNDTGDKISAITAKPVTKVPSFMISQYHANNNATASLS